MSHTKKIYKSLALLLFSMPVFAQQKHFIQIKVNRELFGREKKIKAEGEGGDLEENE